jgi:alkaline phosphatase D
MDSARRHIVDLSRRGLLRGATAAAALAFLMPATSRRVLAQPVFHAYPFSMGVASGVNAGVKMHRLAGVKMHHG